MTNGIRLAGICCVTVALCVAILVALDVPQIWGPLIGILAFLLGAPLAVRAVLKKLGRPVSKDLELSWHEWHALVSGWADKVAFNKSERVPNLKEIPEEPKDDDFYAVIAREAWYYKAGNAFGVLTWVLLIRCFLEIWL